MCVRACVRAYVRACVSVCKTVKTQRNSFYATDPLDRS